MKNIRRTTCENCGAPYAIDVSQLRYEENRVTCRRCKHKMIIYKSENPNEPSNEQALLVNDDEKTQIDDGPQIQMGSIPLETAISKAPPPFTDDDRTGIRKRKFPNVFENKTPRAGIREQEIQIRYSRTKNPGLVFENEYSKTGVGKPIFQDGGNFGTWYLGERQRKSWNIGSILFGAK